MTQAYVTMICGGDAYVPGIEALAPTDGRKGNVYELRRNLLASVDQAFASNTLLDGHQVRGAFARFTFSNNFTKNALLVPALQPGANEDTAMGMITTPAYVFDDARISDVAVGIERAVARDSGVTVAALRGGDHAGLIAILFLFAVVWATDILAYFVGRAVGGPKLAPAISPGKAASPSSRTIPSATASRSLTALPKSGAVNPDGKPVRAIPLDRRADCRLFR